VSASLMTMKPPDVGDVIADKYQLLRMLGRGSTGEVWLARHKTLVEGVAIKLLRQTLWTGVEEERAQAATRFQFEAQIAARLARKTRHIVRVTDHGEADGIAYLVMEFLDGMTLETRLTQGEALSPVEVQELVRQVARALDYAHAEGVVHRDLKPSNLFLTQGEDGEMLVKILDFGIAQMMRGRAPSGSFATGRELIFGTPGYMSPEQALGCADLDGRCDLWALATIAYESLTNELPVVGTSVNELINAARSARTIPLRQYRPDLPHSVGAFFEQAFREDSDARFATAAELTRALDRAFADERPRDQLPRRPRRMAMALWLVTIVATGFIGTTWRSLAQGVDRLTHVTVALAAPESTPATAPATSPPPPAEIPSIETVPMLAASASAPIQKPIRKMMARTRPQMTTATTASDVRTAADRGVVPSVATMSAPKPECDPPYVVDATTGKKHWKLECM
jgi:eukaryotic-like serine/threonine-protein kinase